MFEKLNVRITRLPDHFYSVLFTTESGYKQFRMAHISGSSLWYVVYYFNPEVELEFTHDPFGGQSYANIKTRDDLLDLFADPSGDVEGEPTTFGAMDAIWGENSEGLTRDEAVAVLDERQPMWRGPDGGE